MYSNMYVSSRTGQPHQVSHGRNTSRVCPGSYTKERFIIFGWRRLQVCNSLIQQMILLQWQQLRFQKFQLQQLTRHWIELTNGQRTIIFNLPTKKVEAIMLSRKWAYAEPLLKVGDFKIQFKRNIKYLRLYFNSHLTFRQHANNVMSKSNEAANTIGRLMPKIEGSSQKKRMSIMTIINCRLLYAVSIWTAKTVRYDMNCDAIMHS